jgi:hypothetical protein
MKNKSKIITILEGVMFLGAISLIAMALGITSGVTSDTETYWDWSGLVSVHCVDDVKWSTVNGRPTQIVNSEGLPITCHVN